MTTQPYARSHDGRVGRILLQLAELDAIAELDELRQIGARVVREAGRQV